ncbi:telomere length regulation protein TEL2 homolog isoform X2 [Hydractinia symbiolongicarpus]|uniref:telomere length regulation protein TEL2 homolog isoform X2 n=1 Tax=Hydractinia symbiolongicarpus TaxID=13093 RepID=UPI00254B3D41|nr:telomere length regulation protein TEL2 homolog isoform X2 [Hydractinia symbiolongicarpus]
MAEKCAPSSCLLLSLKEWLRNVSSIENVVDFFNQLESNVFEKQHGSIELLQSLKLCRKELTLLLKLPHMSKQFCKEVFCLCSKDFLTKSNTSVPWHKFFKVIYDTNVDYVVVNLIELLKEEKHSKVQMKIAECLHYGLKNNIMVELLWKQCLEKPVSITNQKPIFSPSYQMHSEMLIKFLVHIPDHVANTLQLKSSSIFEPEAYFTILCSSIGEVLVKIHHSIQDSRDCSMSFLSQLFAKICAVGKAGILYHVLLPKISQWVTESPLWCRICSRLLLSVPDSLLENCLEPLLVKCESATVFCSLLGDALLSKPKLKFLLTHKFLFVRTYSHDRVAYHIFNYLAEKASREVCYKKTLLKLLEVWGDSSTIKHTSFVQHLYITKCLLLALGCMSQQQRQTWESELILKLMNGMTSHLGSPDKQVHTIGMVVGECLTSIVDKNGKKLNFEVERTSEIDYLYQLSSNPSIALRFTSDESKAKSEKEGVSRQKIVEKESETIGEHEELDSDDDLEPLNVDEEETEDVNGVKPPVYLRDCLAGLLSSNDPGRLEACLTVLEKLVKKEPGDLPDVCVEIVKILLHLENEYTILNFYQMKKSAMLAITVRCPKQISEFIAEQFREENYSINQRLDMLDNIANAAMELSKPNIEDPDMHRRHLPMPVIPGLTNHERKPDWQVVIDERVKSKTRRFAHGSSRTLKSATENQFTVVAGSFFFPFVKSFDMRLNTCNMLDDDCVVLGKFVYTLGVVLQSADGLSIAPAMGKSLLELVWCLRYHREAFVRQSLIYAVTMVVLHVPSYTLCTELHDEIFETRDWLSELLNQDMNSECRKLAASCLVLLDNTLKQELQ